MPLPLSLDASQSRSLETPAPIAAKLTRLGRHGATVAALTAAEHATALQSGWIEISADGTTSALTTTGRAAIRRSLSLRQAERATAAPEPAPVRPATREPAVNVAESPLAWLRSRRDSDGHPLLSDAQFDAGERLRADLWRAQMTPRVTASWSGIPQSRGDRRSAPGSGLDMAEGVLAARMRLERAFKAVGAEHFDLLFDVCGHLKGLEQVEREAHWPRRSARHFLERALTALARH